MSCWQMTIEHQESRDLVVTNGRGQNSSRRQMTKLNPKEPCHTKHEDISAAMFYKYKKKLVSLFLSDLHNRVRSRRESVTKLQVLETQWRPLDL